MLADKVKQLRESKGWARPELARRARMSRDMVAKIENGDTRNPRLDTLCKLKHAFGTTIDELVECPDEENAA